MKIYKYKVTIDLKEKVAEKEMDFPVYKNPIEARREAISYADNWRDVLIKQKRRVI